MHPGNNFIISIFAHSWALILMMVSSMTILSLVSFNFLVIMIALLVTISVQLLVLSEGRESTRKYTNTLMALTVIIYTTFIVYKLLSYDEYVDRYEIVDTTEYTSFYQNTGDHTNDIYFVKPNERGVSFVVSLDDESIKKYLGGTNPQLRRHITNSKWFQYDDIDYDVVFKNSTGEKDAE